MSKPSTMVQAIPGPDTLDALAQEAAATAPPPEAEGEAAPGAESTAEIIAPPVTEGLRVACRTVVAVMGGLICARADVEPLRELEIVQTGDALAGVAAFYLPADGDPRIMAWLTLALAIAGVAAPRVAQARRQAEPAPPPPRPGMTWQSDAPPAPAA